jgi:hypothetical protein
MYLAFESPTGAQTFFISRSVGIMDLDSFVAKSLGLKDLLVKYYGVRT